MTKPTRQGRTAGTPATTWVAFPLRCGHPETGRWPRGRGSPLERPSKYTEEFRRDAVDLVRSSQRPINQVARELGMSYQTLRN
ncbi:MULTISPECIES: transposase [Micromonospora]